MTGGWIRADVLRATDSLYGPNRSARPSDVQHADRAACPFCPGHEALTGPPLTTDPGPAWESRVVANRYPAVVDPDGRHEVIVELRDHDANWALLERAERERILRVYQEREAAAFADGYAFAVVFKNAGAAAGASLRHPHAQLVALRALPRSIAARLDRLTPACGICAVTANGIARVVVRTPDFVAYVPDGSRTAFEVRIAPVRHDPHFSRAGDDAAGGLAEILDGVMKRLVATLGEDLPFNVVVQSAPRDPRAEAYLHWEIEVVPRRENFGGYELGTGGFLVSRTPEAAAGILREARAFVGA